MKLSPLDKLFSEVIRRRAIQRAGGCERCGAPKSDIQKDDGEIYPAWKQLQCAHLISRWHKSIRHDLDVALGLCGGCHMWIDHEAEEKIALLVSKIGQEKYDLLQARARTPAKYIDINLITLYLKEELRKLNDN